MLRTDIKLGNYNQFFFDSRCFQFLAAYKQLDRLMPDKERCEWMWIESAKAANCLIEQTVRLPIHQVRKTLSLHRVRKHLHELITPLAAFTTGMKMTEAKWEENKKELGELDIRKGDLDEKPKNDKITYFVPSRNNLERPRTVCGDRQCLDVKTDWAGSQHATYPKNCHPVCFLDTPNEVMGTPKLARCFAFNNIGDICTVCGHDWMKHLHVSYTPSFEEVSEDDDRISTEIKNTEEAKKAIHHRLEKYENELCSLKKELGLISGAQAQFGVYLDRHAISACNNATSGHLDYQIHLAKMAGKIANADRLEKQKTAHERQVQDLKEAIANKGVEAPDEAALDNTIEKLYKMPLFGNYLKKEFPQPQSLVSVERRPQAFELTKPGNRFSWFWNSGARTTQTLSGIRHQLGLGTRSHMEGD